MFFLFRERKSEAPGGFFSLNSLTRSSLYRYEFTSSYQQGLDTHLLPSKDTGLSVRMAEYTRRSGAKVPRTYKSKRGNIDLCQRNKNTDNGCGNRTLRLSFRWENRTGRNDSAFRIGTLTGAQGLCRSSVVFSCCWQT